MQFKDMKVGDEAVVVKLTGEGQLRKRLLDLGITKGTRISLVRMAPLGDPIEIELRGYRLTLRKHEATVVELEPAEKECCCGSCQETPAEEPAAEEAPAEEAPAEAKAEEPAKEESE